jgi:hypothetical protein
METDRTTIQLTRAPDDAPPPVGIRRVIDGAERAFYCGYWIKTYPLPADSLQAKKNLIEALTRRLFNHTEHGLNIPGARLKDARAAYDAESDPAKRRVKGGMLAGALFNRATDIFRRLVELQSDGVDIQADYPLVEECGHCLMEALELGHLVRHRSGEEGIDELWGETFRAYSLSIEDFYEGRYIKIAQCMRDIDRIAASMIEQFGRIRAFAAIAPAVADYATAARIKCETLRTDRQIFDVWSNFVTAGERLTEIAHYGGTRSGIRIEDQQLQDHADGVQLIEAGRTLICDIVRARTPMPKSTREYIARMGYYGEHNARALMTA